MPASGISNGCMQDLTFCFNAMGLLSLNHSHNALCAVGNDLIEMF